MYSSSSSIHISQINLIHTFLTNLSEAYNRTPAALHPWRSAAHSQTKPTPAALHPPLNTPIELHRHGQKQRKWEGKRGEVGFGILTVTGKSSKSHGTRHQRSRWRGVGGGDATLGGGWHRDGTYAVVEPGFKTCDVKLNSTMIKKIENTLM